MKTNITVTFNGIIKDFTSTEDATAFLMRFNNVIKKQNKFVIAKLLKDGAISRNFALANFITRLSARISQIKEMGYETKGAWDIERKDYFYTLIRSNVKIEKCRKCGCTSCEVKNEIMLDEELNDYITWFIKCNKCGEKGQKQSTQKHAVMFWNAGYKI